MLSDAEKIAMLRSALKLCDGLFSDIRNDWSDPRSECREGRAIIDAALSATADTGPNGVERRTAYEIEYFDKDDDQWASYYNERYSEPEMRSKLAALRERFARTQYRPIRVDEVRTVIDPPAPAKAEKFPAQRHWDAIDDANKALDEAEARHKIIAEKYGIGTAKAEHVPCGYNEPYRGPCTKPGSPHCEEHTVSCFSCGKPATHGCDHAGQFVCGYPLCDDCVGRNGENGHLHKPKGDAKAEHAAECPYFGIADAPKIGCFPCTCDSTRPFKADAVK